MGLYPQYISLTSAGECSESILILRDGNSTIYPLAKDCADAIRDPQWLDLPPVKCVSAGTLALNITSQNMKNQVALIVMALEQQTLMPRILRCDLEGVKQVLIQLDNETKSNPTIIQNVLSERCDGNRNILHACVNMCTPTSNKDGDNETTSTNTNPGLECINVITNALGPRSVSLREMMRRATAAASRSNLERDLGAAAGVDPPPVAPPLHEEPIPTLSWPPESFDPTSGDEDSLMGLGAGASAKGGTGILVVDPAERRNNALQALQAMCESQLLAPYLKELLSAK